MQPRAADADAARASWLAEQLASGQRACAPLVHLLGVLALVKRLSLTSMHEAVPLLLVCIKQGSVTSEAEAMARGSAGGRGRTLSYTQYWLAYWMPDTTAMMLSTTARASVCQYLTAAAL